MISARKLVYDFDREFSRFNTGSSKVLKLVDKLAFLNNAQKMLYEDRVKKAETREHIRQEIRNFENKDKELTKVREAKRYDVFSFPDGMYKPLRLFADISKECCDPKEGLPVIMMQTDDLSRSLNNPFWEPDFRWEQVLADEGSEGFFVWHNCDFKIDRLRLDYYRQIQEIHCPSLKKPDSQYEDWNGKIQTRDQGSELDIKFSDIKIVKLAVLMARSTVSDVTDYGIKLKEILETDQISTL